MLSIPSSNKVVVARVGLSVQSLVSNLRTTSRTKNFCYSPINKSHPVAHLQIAVAEEVLSTRLSTTCCKPRWHLRPSILTPQEEQDKLGDVIGIWKDKDQSSLPVTDVFPETILHKSKLMSTRVLFQLLLILVTISGDSTKEELLTMEDVVRDWIIKSTLSDMEQKAIENTTSSETHGEQDGVNKAT